MGLLKILFIKYCYDNFGRHFAFYESILVTLPQVFIFLFFEILIFQYRGQRSRGPHPPFDPDVFPG